MSFNDVMYGSLGQLNNSFQNNLAQNQAAMQQQQNFAAQQQAIAAQNQASLNNAYGPAGFGGDTARYAAAGAEYGRAVPGEIYGSSQPMGSVFDTGTVGFNTYGVPDNLWGRMSQADKMSFNQQMGGQGGVPQAAPNQQDTIGYTPDSTTSQNGFGYPSGPGAGSGVNPSQMFDPKTYGSTGMGVPGGNYSAPGSGNTYGVDPSVWGRMSAGDKMSFNMQMANQGAQAAVGSGDPGASFDDRFGQYGGATPQQQQNQPAIDAVNNAAKGVPQLSDFGPNYGNPNQSMPFAGGGGASNTYGVDAATWARMSPSDHMSFNAQMAGQGAQPSYLDAGQPGSNYNPLGTINSGQIGTQDNFGGYQPPATFDQRYGNIPGQPYGSSYFDNTFGSVNGKSAYNPTAGGGYPGPMASDYQAQQQQMIQDLYKTLGIVDNAGEDSGYSGYPPSGNTLRPEDYFPGGSAAYSRGGG